MNGGGCPAPAGAGTGILPPGPALLPPTHLSGAGRDGPCGLRRQLGATVPSGGEGPGPGLTCTP